jgi:hypothetical protein
MNARAITARSLAAGLSHRLCDVPTLRDLIEEPFDQVTRVMQITAEADRLLAISLQWDICPRAPRAETIAQPLTRQRGVDRYQCTISIFDYRKFTNAIFEKNSTWADRPVLTTTAGNPLVLLSQKVAGDVR